MTVYFAIDAVNGLTLPDGEIVGLTSDLTRLRTNGFDAATYTGNRLAQIDENAAGWNSACQPRITDSSNNVIENGWYWVNGVVVPTFSSELDDMKNEIYNWQNQALIWTAGLQTRGVVQPPAKEAQGRARILSSGGYIYLVCNNSSHSLTDRKIMVANTATGAQDVRKVDDFYSTDTGTFPPSGGTHNTFGVTSSWHNYIDIADPSTKLRLSDTQAVVMGNIPTSVLLLDREWVANIPA